jgi:hypothetical protein
VLLEWHSLDHIPLSESYWPVYEPWDYVHINSIDVDYDGNLLVSSRNTHTVYKIDRHSGAVIWRLGGKSGDFSLASGAAFAWQHDVRRQANGTLTIFDNEGLPNANTNESRAIVLAVDEPGRKASLLREYRHPTPLLATSQGSVQVLPNGNIFVGWGAEPYVSEFSASGELLFDAQLGDKYLSYRAFRMPWTGAPEPARTSARCLGELERRHAHPLLGGPRRWSRRPAGAGLGASAGRFRDAAGGTQRRPPDRGPRPRLRRQGARGVGDGKCLSG